ncbi:MAG: hypothetical protein JHC39_07390 [Lentimicrobium sp.]|jgi:hypothetical protein|nr:hypothetical protein [Lentimicrobium sp.]
MDRIQKIALLKYDKKELEEQIAQLMVEDSGTGLTIHQISEIEILQEEIKKIDEMIDKREHQTDQIYNSEMLSRFLKIINNDGQLDEEAKEWWQTRY